MLEILWGTSCYGNRVGRLARVGGVTTATSLGGQVMLKGRLWRSRHENTSFTRLMGEGEGRLITHDRRGVTEPVRVQDCLHAGPRGAGMSPQLCWEEKLITAEGKKPKDAVSQKTCRVWRLCCRFRLIYPNSSVRLYCLSLRHPAGDWGATLPASCKASYDR